MSLLRIFFKRPLHRNSIYDKGWVKTGIGLILFFMVLDAEAQQTKMQETQNSKRFRAAVVKTDITPTEPKMLLGYAARKSTGVLDHIYQKIIALDDGTSQFFLVSTEICLISPSEIDKVGLKLKQRFGINPMNVWWTVTHTHSAPEVGVPGLLGSFLGERYHHDVDTAYANFIEQKLIEGIEEALSKLAPARLGVGWGFSQANINRRAIDVEGKATLGLNPEGPVDRRIGLLRIEKEDGSLMALIANYAIHGTVLGGESLDISGDAPGVVAEYVEQQTGAPMLFINGAAGDLAPIYSVYPNAKSGHLGQFRVLLGDRIIEANRLIAGTSAQVSLTSGALTVETPRNPKLNNWPADLANYATTTSSGVRMVRLPVRFLKINDNVAIWSAPVELFCDISNAIRERSPYAFTFYFGYSHGWLGYLPTEEQYKFGGYEVERVSPYTPSAAKDLTRSVLGYLEGEMKNSIPEEGSEVQRSRKKAR